VTKGPVLFVTFFVTMGTVLFVTFVGVFKVLRVSKVYGVKMNITARESKINLLKKV
jgi:hypothetical protein